ncbi:MAG TPA: glycosyltransferase family 2 protein, partial [Vicinamibacterales bacterium]
VIVESRSTDGTRELVQSYEGRDGIVVVYEDRPRGKGAAVRNGLQRATGTIVIIQDADDEYDVNDYDALLEPIVTYHCAFVLGSRHMGSFKVRNFANQPAVSAFFNFGHVLFRTLFNVIYGQKLDDPFTMYKVFRRDCLHRLKFECNRFDFDFELVIKLVRKGYIPLEIPVNYTSRSFADGKKVSAFRDPLTWIRALVKYRFQSIYTD